MSDWARQALDKDDTLRAEALCALSRFNVFTGTNQTVRILQSIATNDDFGDDERGAAIVLAHWLRFDPSPLLGSYRREIPLLFATIVKHDQDWNWRKICDECVRWLSRPLSRAYGDLYDSDDAKQIESSARKFMNAGVAEKRMRWILASRQQNSD
jgi:hypothetical protein